MEATEKLTGKTRKKNRSLDFDILTVGYLARPGLLGFSREFRPRKFRGNATGQSSAEGSWKASTGSRLAFRRRFKESVSTALSCAGPPRGFFHFISYTQKIICLFFAKLDRGVENLFGGGHFFPSLSEKRKKKIKKRHNFRRWITRLVRR